MRCCSAHVLDFGAGWLAASQVDDMVVSMSCSPCQQAAALIFIASAVQLLCMSHDQWELAIVTLMLNPLHSMQHLMCMCGQAINAWIVCKHLEGLKRLYLKLLINTSVGRSVALSGSSTLGTWHLVAKQVRVHMQVEIQ